MEKKGVGRPRDGNPEETRREILRAAAEAFAACGFVGATTRAVAARAGVNVATLHYHFGSKEGLYRAVLGNACRGTLPAVPPGTGARRSPASSRGSSRSAPSVRPSRASPSSTRSPGPGPREGRARRKGPLARRGAPSPSWRRPTGGRRRTRGGRAIGRRARRRHLRRRSRAGTGSPLRPSRARRHRSRRRRFRTRRPAPPSSRRPCGSAVSAERGRPVPAPAEARQQDERVHGGSRQDRVRSPSGEPRGHGGASPEEHRRPGDPGRTERRGAKATSVGRMSPDAKIV